MRRNQNNNKMTENEFDRMLTADLKLSVSENVGISEDLIRRTLAAAKRGEEPKTPMGEEMLCCAQEETAGKKETAFRYSRNLTAAAAVLVVLFAGGYAFTNFLSGGKKSADNAAGGAMTTAQATMAAKNEAMATPEKEAGTDNGAADSAGSSDCLPAENEADGAAGGVWTEEAVPDRTGTDGTEAAGTETAKQNEAKDKKAENTIFTSQAEFAAYADLIEKSDIITAAQEGVDGVILSEEQRIVLLESFSDMARTAVSAEASGEQTEGGSEEPIWVITVSLKEEDPQLIIKAGNLLEVSIISKGICEEKREYQVQDIQSFTKLLASFMN